MAGESVLEGLASVPRVRNPLIWSHVRVKRRLRHSDLNMTPIMNLLVILIPFLLVSVSFVELAVVHSALSEISAAPGEELKASLIVEITANGYGISSRSVDLKYLVNEGKKRAGSGSLTVTRHNRLKLQQMLRNVKRFFPEEREISIAPQADIPYQLVVRTMDAVREYRDGKDITPLFPNIAFIKIRKALPKP